MRWEGNIKFEVDGTISLSCQTAGVEYSSGYYIMVLFSLKYYYYYYYHHDYTVLYFKIWA
jgi:hypothetical protein